MGSFCSLSEPRIHNIVRLGLKLMRIRREWAHGDLSPGRVQVHQSRRQKAIGTLTISLHFFLMSMSTGANS